MSTLTPAAQPQNPRLSRRGRYAVLLLSTPEGWKPSSPKSPPPEFTSARYLMRRLRCRDAATIAQAHNLARVQQGGDGTDWAVVVSSMFGVVE